MRIRIESTSNQATRRKARQASIDKVSGNKLLRDDPLLVRHIEAAKLRRGGTLAEQDKGIGDNLSSDEDTMNADVVNVTEKTEEPAVKISTSSFIKTNGYLVSESADVIFVPYTHTTRYSMSKSAKRNLERRMPGCEVSINDVSGEGQIDFELTATLSVDDRPFQVRAEGIASPYEMAVHTVIVNCNDRTFNIDPVDKARSPEKTLEFLQRMVGNLAKNM